MELRFEVPQVNGKLDTSFLRSFCDLIDGNAVLKTPAQTPVAAKAKAEKTGASAASGSKRKRRTKAEIEAEKRAKAQEENEAEEDEDLDLAEEEDESLNLDDDELNLDEDEEEETEEDEVEEEPELSLADVVKAFQAYAKKHSTAKAKLILKKFNAANTKDIKKSQYPLVMKYLSK